MAFELKDWASVSFDEARTTLRTWREENVRRSEEIVELWEHVISRGPSSLGDEAWIVYEQVFIAALDCARLDVATECLQALEKQFPQSHRVMKLQAMQLEAIEKYDEAMKVYDMLIKNDETNAGYRKRKIAVLKAQGKTSEAIKALTEYLKTFLNDPEAWTELSNLYLSEQDYGRAAHCLEEMILGQPLNHLFHQRYAEIKYTHGGLENMEIAKQHYGQAAKLNSGNLRALYGLFLSCSWLAQKSSGQKKKEMVSLANWAADQAIQKYYSEAQTNPNVEIIASSIEKMKKALQLACAASGDTVLLR